MPSLATAAWFVYLALAFGLRSYAQYRATGRTGFVGLSGARTNTERFAVALFVLALVLGLGAAVTGLVSTDQFFTRPLVALTRAQPILGAVVFVAGLATTLLAQFVMGASWRIGVDANERTTLVTSGPFRYVRNPIFSAMMLAGAGIVLLYPSLPALLAYGCLWVALELQVRFVEEPYLLATHGAAYRDYGARAGRFVPGVGTFRRARAGTGAGTLTTQPRK